MWKAIRDVFPTASIKGCVFHFTQAVWRKTQELGLKTTYSQRGAEYRYIRMLMALIVSEEQILRDQRQKQKRMEGRLHQCWQEYEQDTRTAPQLLSECGKIYGQSNMAAAT